MPKPPTQDRAARLEAAQQQVGYRQRSFLRYHIKQHYPKARVNEIEEFVLLHPHFRPKRIELFRPLLWMADGDKHLLNFWLRCAAEAVDRAESDKLMSWFNVVKGYHGSLRNRFDALERLARTLLYSEYSRMLWVETSHFTMVLLAKQGDRMPLTALDLHFSQEAQLWHLGFGPQDREATRWEQHARWAEVWTSVQDTLDELLHLPRRRRLQLLSVLQRREEVLRACGADRDRLERALFDP